MIIIIIWPRIQKTADRETRSSVLSFAPLMKIYPAALLKILLAFLVCGRWACCNFQQLKYLLTWIVTVVNGVVIHPCPVRIHPSVTVVILFSVKTNPFRTSLSPHYLLARGRTISHQKKRFDGRKLNGLHFISVCSAAVVNSCVTAIHAVRKNTSFVVLVKPVFVIPSNVAVLESSRAWALLVNAVFAFKLDKRRENINW